MTTAGWIFMICSVTFVVSLATFCYYRVLTKPTSADHMGSPLEAPSLDTHE